ncbi:hypothetical protein [Streptomyces chartreusis]|uniref:hypothetical protein n=1 Tax=Streptomyces chartreusis TaxID=1969 RepID=UPI00365C7CF9
MHIQLLEEALRDRLLAAHALAEQAGAAGATLDELLEQMTPDLSDDEWWVVGDQPLSTEDEQRVAEETADSINRTLARLLVRLGPPPTGLGGVATPVSSGDGGSAR